MAAVEAIRFSGKGPSKIMKWKVRQGSEIQKGSILFLYQIDKSDVQGKFKATKGGTVLKCLVEEGTVIHVGEDVMRMQGCTHGTVMKDLCALCGANLRNISGKPGDRIENVSASVAMVHSVPELIVSEEEAIRIGREDELRLLRNRKLVLLVDLDQTLLHTTNDQVPANLKDVHHFQMMHGPFLMWYHTKFRPSMEQFLANISQMYELHICTFGVRVYAHTIAKLLDPEKRYFSHRILSRDECFNPTSKTANLRALFPCGDSMVAIIDDREDVWNFSPNLIHVKPYQFFSGTADINAPPGLNPNKPDGQTEEKKPKAARIVRVRKVKRNTEVAVKSDLKTETVSQSNMLADQIKQRDNEKKSKIELSSSSNENSKDKMETDCTSDAQIVTNVTSIEKIDITPNGSDMQGDDAVTVGSTEKEIELPNDTGQSTQNPDKVNAKTLEDLSISSSEDENETEESSVQTEEKARDTIGKGDNVPAPKTVIDTKESPSLEVSSAVTAEEPAKEEIKNSSDNTKEIADDDGTETDSNEYEEMVEWEDSDDYLLYLQDILTRIHTAFYECYDQTKGRETKLDLPSLKKIIPYVHKKVLKGTNIVFSGMFPTNLPAEKSRAYVVARSLGANIQPVFVSPDGREDGEATTHVVAARPGTFKVKQARKYKTVHVTTAEWLWTCADRWERVDERIYPLNEDSINMPPQDSPDPFHGRDVMHRKRKSDDEVTIQTATGQNVHKPSKAAKIEGITSFEVEKTTSEEAQPSTSCNTNLHPLFERRFSESYNPMLAFSRADIDDMDKEVGDILDGSSEDEDSDLEKQAEKEEIILRCKVLKPPQASSSEDSLSADFPRGWKRKYSKKAFPKNAQPGDKTMNMEEDDDDQIEDVPDKPDRILRHSSDSDSSDQESDKDSFDDSIGSVDEEMAAAVEKELLNF